jgi:hypothetical protein
MNAHYQKPSSGHESNPGIVPLLHSLQEKLIRIENALTTQSEKITALQDSATLSLQHHRDILEKLEDMSAQSQPSKQPAVRCNEPTSPLKRIPRAGMMKVSSFFAGLQANWG